jgi:apolipoprotein D and lipocalin family protein
MKFLNLNVVFMILCPVFLASCASNKMPELKTVEKVDLSRYLGLWYEIARIDQTFQKGCVATTAEYSLKDDGRIKVLNKCRKNTIDGKEKSAEGVAWVVDKETNAKLKVSFFWPFSGKYWVIDLEPEYKWAVVGDPSREYLWILSRSPEMDDETYEGIMKRLKEQLYDISKIQKYPQTKSDKKN